MIKGKHLPFEVMGRLLALHNHRNLREQRDSFSVIHRHPGGIFRWNAQLLLVPYFHIIETASYGEQLRVHVFHMQSRQILTAAYTNGQWSRVSQTPDDKIRDVVPNRFSRTGWLAKTATKAQLTATARVSGIQKQSLPAITAANANIVIHSAELMQHMDHVSTLYTRWVNELQAPDRPRISKHTHHLHNIEDGSPRGGRLLYI